MHVRSHILRRALHEGRSLVDMVAAPAREANFRQLARVLKDYSMPENETPGLPVVVYDWSDEGIREIADNIWHAQMAGWPRVLTYIRRTRAEKRAIRRKALREIPQIRSRDEYPFASTAENDGSVWIGHATIAQQNAQRDLMNAFYRKHGAYRKGTLTFEVRVVNHPGGEGTQANAT